MPLETIYSISNRIFSGGTPSTQCQEYWGGDIPWLSSGETSNRYIDKTENHITKEGVDNSSTKYAKRGTIVIASAGQGHTRGQTSMLLLDTYINQSIIGIDIDQSKANPWYVFFNISARYNELRSISDGTSSRGSLTTRLIGEMEIELPERPIQDKIAKIIRSIDDKIRINQSINDNLEAICQAKYSQIIEETIVLGDETVISDLGEVVGGSTPSKTVSDYYTECGIPWLTPKDLSENKSKFISRGNIDITEAGLKNSSAKIMPRGSILYTSRAPIGYIAISKNDICTNQGFKSIVPKEKYYTSFIYYYLKNNFDVVYGLASGSTFMEISGTAMKNIPIPKPSVDIAESFESYCSSIFDLQESIETEIEKLSSLRDNLLPKLMSGEIDVSTFKMPN